MSRHVVGLRRPRIFDRIGQDQPHFQFAVILTTSYHETSIQLAMQVREDITKLGMVDIYG